MILNLFLSYTSIFHWKRECSIFQKLGSPLFKTWWSHTSTENIDNVYIFIKNTLFLYLVYRRLLFVGASQWLPQAEIRPPIASIILCTRKKSIDVMSVPLLLSHNSFHYWTTKTYLSLLLLTILKPLAEELKTYYVYVCQSLKYYLFVFVWLDTFFKIHY